MYLPVLRGTEKSKFSTLDKEVENLTNQVPNKTGCQNLHSTTLKGWLRDSSKQTKIHDRTLRLGGILVRVQSNDLLLSVYRMNGSNGVSVVGRQGSSS